MHLTGVILDIYDDPTVSVLRSKLAGAELPEALGGSSMLEPEKLGGIPDRLFGLVATNGDGVVRKYAMHDAPHVATSILYFLEQGHQLPDSVQKTAAQNLVAACGWYDLVPPEALMKVAGLLDAGLGVMDVKQRLEGTMARSGATMDGFRAAQAGASSDMQTREKKADLNGTEMMPMSGSISTLPMRSTAKMPSTSPGTKRAQWEHAGDLTTHRPSVKEAKLVTHFCVPSQEKYPIDSYEQAKTASAYFEEHWNKFDLQDRREFAVHLSQRLAELALPLEQHASKYAGSDYGPHIEVELATRVRNYEGTGHEEGYQLLLEKKASTPPHVMLDMIHELDQASGANSYYERSLGFRDPFQAVYGKVAEAEAPKPWSWSEGNEYVNDVMLKDLAVNRYQSLDRAFGMDMRKSFQKDPVGVFTSLPDPQKVVVSRLAADDAKG